VKRFFQSANRVRLFRVPQAFVLLICLFTKSAILVVEFAKVLREEGKTVLEAALEAMKLRFRAVMMTALSFILGVIPLLIAISRRRSLTHRAKSGDSCPRWLCPSPPSPVQGRQGRERVVKAYSSN
jgi:hypothetical protein